MKDEPSMPVEGNNGDVLATLALVCDNFAWVNHATAQIETRHDDKCDIFAYMPETGGFKYTGLTGRKPNSEKAMEHFYRCNCDVTIEALFQRKDGNTCFLALTLSELKARVPKLNDEDSTKEMLETARELGAMNRLIHIMQPLFENILPSGPPLTAPRPEILA